MLLTYIVEQSDFFARSSFIMDALEAQKPLFRKADFTKAWSVKDGAIALENSKFGSKLRVSANQKLVLVSKDGKRLGGSAIKAVGKRTIIKPEEELIGEIMEVEVLGRATGTQSDLHW